MKQLENVTGYTTYIPYTHDLKEWYGKSEDELEKYALNVKLKKQFLKNCCNWEEASDFDHIEFLTPVYWLAISNEQLSAALKKDLWINKAVWNQQCEMALGNNQRLTEPENDPWLKWVPALKHFTKAMIKIFIQGL